MNKTSTSKLVAGDKTMEKKEDKNWISKAIKNPGGLHKALGIKEGKKIPAKTLDKAAAKGGKIGKMANLAKTLKKMK